MLEIFNEQQIMKLYDEQIILLIMYIILIIFSGSNYFFNHEIIWLLQYQLSVLLKIINLELVLYSFLVLLNYPF